MMLTIPRVLDAEGLAECRRLAEGAGWVDGNVTSGPQSAMAKRNRQLPEDSAEARAMGQRIVAALGRNPLFIAAALPARIFPPLFNAYRPGDRFGTHVDNAVRIQHGTDFRIRSDLSATLFLAEPDSYDGGELVVEDTYGAHAVKLPAGDMVLYPASSLHHVSEVTRGVRIASFFWLQSMVRDDAARTILFDLDQAVQVLATERGQDDAEVIRLTGIYHNLLRRWAEV